MGPVPIPIIYRYTGTDRRNKKVVSSADLVGDQGITGLTKTSSSPDCSMELDSPSSSLCGLLSDALENSSSFRIELGQSKAEISAAVSIPAEALQAFWTEGYRKSWGVKLQSSSSAEELFQILTLLEGAIKRGGLSTTFETTAELLSSANPGVADNNTAHSGSVPVLPWVPSTTAAVALRLLDLDSSISYMLHPKLESHQGKEGDYIMLPSRYAVVHDKQEVELMGTSDQVNHQTEGRWLDLGRGGRGRSSRGRRGRGRGRGGRRLIGSGNSSRTELRTENNGSFEKATRKYNRRGRTRGQGHRRGRRTVRPRQRSENRVATIDKRSLLGSFVIASSSSKQSRIEASPESSDGEQWGIGETEKTYIEDDDSRPCLESDENGQASGEDYDDQAVVSSDRDECDADKREGLVDDETEDDLGDMEGDEQGEADDDYHDGKDLNTYMDDEDVEIGDNADVGDAEGNGDEDDDGAWSASSEYSD
ncbi:hypothetical protein BHE74_00056510 [Ensete ventricosum]|uniref:Uncharacterized protein n=1 Tax=Ensete ventricosum TaxID=4639 RepID=A0A426XX41_ENSVE|nr:hypothetical protein B296_00056018 [Ensete ventricosum]RWW38268.1 hypothetical protein BHE74_00056510 [Ensete ventricosum]RZS15474.1 hypothetical protein BHM03_00047316 [Ensete ventricosum]